MSYTGGAAVKIRQVKSSRDRKDFIKVPKVIYAGLDNWVAPLDMETFERLSEKKNPFFEFGDAAFWVVERDGHLVGRISAQYDRRHQELYNDGCGFFGHMDMIDDADVFHALFNVAEDWLREQGFERARGPFQLTINDETGLLIDGFDQESMIMMGFAQPYHQDRITELGYTKCKDMNAFQLNVGEDLNPKAERLIKQGNLNSNLTIRPIDMKKVDQEIATIFEVFTDAWAENWGYLPLSEKEKIHATKNLKMICVPELALIAELDGKAIGIMMGVPNLNAAIHDLNGKLFPFGWLKLLWRLKVKGIKSGRVILAGVKKEFNGSVIGMTAIAQLVATIQKNAAALGYETGEMSWVLEDNKPVQRLMLMGGYAPYKTYRLFQKDL